MSQAIVRTFELNISDAQLTDLKQRLAATRFPEAETPDDWSQGVPLSYAQELTTYWLEEYDWRAREAYYNRFPQFKVNLQGLDIHFLHVKSPVKDARPLLMTHGWPGSVVEFHKIVEPLTNPELHGGSAADAFHVV
ncbi:MAG: hypothetical protein ACI9ON_004209, partial [Limisphaerales bacterium]